MNLFLVFASVLEIITMGTIPKDFCRAAGCFRVGHEGRSHKHLTETGNRA